MSRFFGDLLQEVGLHFLRYLEELEVLGRLRDIAGIDHAAVWSVNGCLKERGCDTMGLTAEKAV